MRWLAGLRDARRAYAAQQLATAARWGQAANRLRAEGLGNTLACQQTELAAAWARLKAVNLGGAKLP